MPRENGPAVSSRPAARCLWSSALDNSDAAVGLLPLAVELVFKSACVAYVWMTTRSL